MKQVQYPFQDNQAQPSAWITKSHHCTIVRGGTSLLWGWQSIETGRAERWWSLWRDAEITCTLSFATYCSVVLNLYMFEGVLGGLEPGGYWMIGILQLAGIQKKWFCCFGSANFLILLQHTNQYAGYCSIMLITLLLFYSETVSHGEFRGKKNNTKQKGFTEGYQRKQ